MKKRKQQTEHSLDCPDSLWLDKHAAAALIGISSETIRIYRKRYWEDGHQYQRYNSRTIRYHRELILDWAANRSSPECHQRAIEAYLASLPSNKPKTCGRKPN